MVPQRTKRVSPMDTTTVTPSPSRTTTAWPTPVSISAPTVAPTPAWQTPLTPTSTTPTTTGWPTRSRLMPGGEDQKTCDGTPIHKTGTTEEGGQRQVEEHLSGGSCQTQLTLGQAHTPAPARAGATQVPVPTATHKKALRRYFVEVLSGTGGVGDDG